jgi:hypothetical protein
MDKVGLEPLGPEQMVEAYRKRFKEIEPFTEDALLNLAQMSRGVFRRLLRYITLILDLWEGKCRTNEERIDVEAVKEAVTQSSWLRIWSSNFQASFQNTATCDFKQYDYYSYLKSLAHEGKQNL